MKLAVAFSALILSATSSVVNADPSTARAALDVWDPKITYPNSSTVWEWGNTYTVTWDTSDAPQQITNPNGHITLASHGIEYEVLLAWGFDLRDGHADVTIPPVYTDNQYSIVLFGDSGNMGETFTIEGPINPLGL